MCDTEYNSYVCWNLKLQAENLDLDMFLDRMIFSVVFLVAVFCL